MALEIIYIEKDNEVDAETLNRIQENIQRALREIDEKLEEIRNNG